MWEFFKEGGWGMWAILFLGVALIVSAGRFAVKPERRRTGFLGGLALSTVFATLYALSTDLGMVFYTVADRDKVPDAELARTLLQGLKESSRPVSFGSLILTVAALLFAAGMARAGTLTEGRPSDPAGSPR
jgi:hypothetical protein